ncbi:MAG: hypothetical protein RL557_778 [archaeon]
MIECEIRAFISDEQYAALLDFFQKQGELILEDEQETYYFDGEQDVRIQKNDHYAKVWLKKGKIHDEAREEIEIKCDRKDFEKLQKLFAALQFTIKIKWLRKRKEFNWNGIKISLDITQGYGNIIELEKMTTEEEKEGTIQLLKETLKELKIPLTAKEEFNKKFIFYTEHWRELIHEH